MADRQYLPLAEPFELPVAVTPLPQSLLPLPLPKPRLTLEGLAGPPPIALPYDLPITPPPDVVRPRRAAPPTDRTFVPVALPYDRPLLDPAPLVVRRPLRALGEASTFYGQADAAVTPDLIAMNLVSPLPRPRLVHDVTSGQLPILEAQPMPGDLATTVVAGSQPWVAIPSGMTPGDDSDG